MNWKARRISNNVMTILGVIGIFVIGLVVGFVVAIVVLCNPNNIRLW